MKKFSLNILLAGTVLALGACASGPKTTSLLDQVHADYSQAQGNPKVATYAPVELQAATEAMNKADAAAKERESLETIDKLAYLTKQKIALANEVASRKSSEAEIANAKAVRDKVVLDQRTAEANQARMKAEDAQRAAQAALTAAAVATQQKNAAQANESEAQRLAAEAIARNLKVMAGLTVPVVCTVIGEGGSGGALAIGVGDRVNMLQYSTYSVISPEGCASILWKSADKAPVAADAMGITAQRLKELKLIDSIVEEPLGGAHRDLEKMAKNLKTRIKQDLDALRPLDSEQLLEQRYQRLLGYGYC